MTKSKLFFAKKACVVMLSAAMTLTAAPAVAARAEGAPVGLATGTDAPVEARDTDPEEGYQDKYKDLGYTYVWGDEFSGDSLNTSDWAICTWKPGTVNNELQRYTELEEGNIVVSDGALKLLPKAEKSDTIDCNILKGKGFDDTWSGAVQGSAKGTVSFADGKATVAIENPGDQNWHIQLQQGDLNLIQGHEYEFKMKAVSSAARSVEISFLDVPAGYKWYAGGKNIIGTTEEEISIPFTVTEDTTSTVALQLNFGLVTDDKNPEMEATSVPATVTLSDVVVNDLTAAKEGTSTDVSKGYNFTSGRISTEGIHEFTYGRFESRIRVPKGKGYLPAFWLMANEAKFEAWPKAGEIDIMEVLGDSTDTSHHTIHFGFDEKDGHREHGKAVKADGVDYSADYHIYTVDYEPGKFTWYVDGKEVYTESDWFTGDDETSVKTYPAPFDHEFYVILNLAVGGNWPGNPDQAAVDDMANQSMDVDYVRIYQKDPSVYAEMEEKCTRPEQKSDFREPDANGNYVINGDFSKDIDRSKDSNGDENWILHLEGDAEGSTAVVENNAVTVTPAAAGGQNHSIQLKEQSVPMYRGWEYELSFDAYSTENRTMIVDVCGPNNNWTRYMADTPFNITTEKQTFTYTFTMENATDKNGSLEFNLGNQGSTAPVVLSNIKLTHKSGDLIPEDTSKKLAADGNYILNGSFDIGDKGFGYWEETSKTDAAKSVKNGSNRELKVVAPEGTSEENPILIYQGDLYPILAGSYLLSVDARMEEGGSADAVSVQVVGESVKPEMTTEMKTETLPVKVNEDKTREASNVLISITKPGTYYIDNVKFVDSAIVKNGYFNADMTAFTTFTDGATASGKVEEVGDNKAFVMSIDDTGEALADDYHVQLIQDGFTLEQGKMYRVSFKAKSTIERSIKYAVQQNGNIKGNSWINYSQNGDEIKVGPEWQEYSEIFTMTEPTDTKSRFAITMGNVAGTHITEHHDVMIDDIVIEENYGLQPIRDLTKAKITVETTPVYNGQEQKPELSVNLGLERIIPSWYEASYSNNVNAGTASVKITGKGAEALGESKEATFTIAKKGITLEDMKFKDKYYNGSKYMVLTTQEGTIKSGLVKGDDVKFTTKRNDYVITGTKSAGQKKRKLTAGLWEITGKDAGNYKLAAGPVATGTIKKIVVKSVTLKAASAKYDGKAHKPVISKITGTNNVKVLVKNCKVEYLRNGKATKDFTSKGKITVKVTGTGSETTGTNWKGTATAVFTIQ